MILLTSLDIVKLQCLLEESHSLTSFDSHDVSVTCCDWQWNIFFPSPKKNRFNEAPTKKVAEGETIFKFGIQFKQRDVEVLEFI